MVELNSFPIFYLIGWCTKSKLDWRKLTEFGKGATKSLNLRYGESKEGTTNFSNFPTNAIPFLHLLPLNQ